MAIPGQHRKIYRKKKKKYGMPDGLGFISWKMRHVLHQGWLDERWGNKGAGLEEGVRICWRADQMWQWQNGKVTTKKKEEEVVEDEKERGEEKCGDKEEEGKEAEKSKEQGIREWNEIRSF